MDKDDDGEDETQGKSRYPVLPSLIALQQMRNRLATAKSGRRLMQWSALATGAELRRIAKELGAVYVAFADEVANAFMMLARCRYFYPNLNKMVTENNPSKACVTVGRNFKSIAGCKISTFGIEDNCTDSYPFLAIDRGGDTVAETKKVWYELLRKLIWINQLRSNYISLQNSHDQTNNRHQIYRSGQGGHNYLNASIVKAIKCMFGCFLSTLAVSTYLMATLLEPGSYLAAVEWWRS